MTDKKIISVFNKYRAMLPAHAKAERGDTGNKLLFSRHSADFDHLAWMCSEGVRFVEEGRKEKAMRWLGFIQGIFASLGRFSVQELGEHSAPHDPLKNINDDQLRPLLRDVVEQLYPEGNAAYQWTPDTIDNIAVVLENAGVKLENTE